MKSSPVDSENWLHRLGFVEAAGHHNLHVGPDAADVAPDLMTVHARHGEIEQHDGDAVVQAAEEVGAVAAVGGLENAVTEMLQGRAGGAPNHVFVVDDKDRACRRLRERLGGIEPAPGRRPRSSKPTARESAP